MWWYLLMICCHYLRQCPVIEFEEDYLIKVCCNDGIASLCCGIWKESVIVPDRWWHPEDDVVKLSHIKNKARQIELLSVCQALFWGYLLVFLGFSGGQIRRFWWQVDCCRGMMINSEYERYTWFSPMLLPEMGAGCTSGIFTFSKIGIFLPDPLCVQFRRYIYFLRYRTEITVHQIILIRNRLHPKNHWYNYLQISHLH